MTIPEPDRRPHGYGHGHLEPLAVHLTVQAGAGGVLEPDRLVMALITDIAARCEAAGSTLVGHIKCHAQADADPASLAFTCNLTSTRLGARCSGDVRPLAHDEALEIDLVVLVYGLSRRTVEETVRAGCASLAGSVPCTAAARFSSDLD